MNGYETRVCDSFVCLIVIHMSYYLVTVLLTVIMNSVFLEISMLPLRYSLFDSLQNVILCSTVFVCYSLISEVHFVLIFIGGNLFMPLM
jgi:hypothetical protein